jgi:hypothetical protein
MISCGISGLFGGLRVPRDALVDGVPFNNLIEAVCFFEARDCAFVAGLTFVLVDDFFGVAFLVVFFVVFAFVVDLFVVVLLGLAMIILLFFQFITTVIEHCCVTYGLFFLVFYNCTIIFSKCYR